MSTTLIMDPDVKAKWVTALRSGQYQQTSAVLRSDDGQHCCLGVLCEVSKLETGFGIEANLQETGGDEFIGLTLKQWAGLPGSSGAVVVIHGYRKSLAQHNDTGCTFAEIADAIEVQL